MNITGGYHYHTVRAENEATIDAIERALAEKGYLAPGEKM
jgi:transcriptional regulator of NAD metabolism